MDSLRTVLPLVKELVQEEICIVLTDKTKYLEQYPHENFVIPVVLGSEIPPGNPILEAMKNKKTTVSVVPKEVHGFPFLAICYPVIDDDTGEVLGAVSVAKNINKQAMIEDAANTIFTSLQHANASIQEIAAGSQKQFSSVSNIVQTVKQTEEKINEIDSILSAIQNIASQSNLLSLNAAIEAARAGSAGLGFSVVADEMRKLSSLSSTSAKEITKTLSEIKALMLKIVQEVDISNTIAEAQASATEQITTTLEEITSASEVMVNLSKIELH